jgi:iron(III) transport system substrate-binding protein
MKRPLLLVCCALIATGCSRPAEDDLVVYSARSEYLIQPIFEQYAEETGVKIRFLSDNEASLIARLVAEGAQSPADILMTVDAGNLWQAAEQGVLREISSETLSRNIPAALRDPDMQWVGLSVRARTLVYSTERVDPSTLSTYEALAGDAWQGKLCLRTAKKVYNQSLVATMIAALGEADTETVVRGWVRNLSAPPFANDTAVIEAIAAGRCDVGLVNTYYFGRLIKDNPDLPVALFWANQGEGERGLHVNVSGAGVTRASRQPEKAIAFLEWLSQGQAQAMFAGSNLEFPANPAIESDPIVAAWGEFRPDTLNVSEAGRRQVPAVRLMDRAGYQ